MSHRPSSVIATCLLSVGLTWTAFGQNPTFDLEVLNTPIGAPPRVFGVNDQGDVVGDYWLPNGDHPPIVVPRGSAMTFLPTLPGAISGTAFAVNNAGVIGGVCYVVTGPNTQGRACLWTPTPSGYVVQALPLTPQGVEPDIILGLNELGDAVGKLANGHGFVWNAATGTTNTQSLGMDPDAATGVNELRQVVSGHQRIDLDTNAIDVGLIPSVPWDFSDINDSGVCTAVALSSIGSQFKGGKFEFGVGVDDFGANLPTGVIAGISYSGDVAGRSQSLGTFLHVDGVGEFGLHSLLDPSASAWSLAFVQGATMSANGLIAASASNTLTAETRVVLLVPQRFHAILETVAGAAGPPVLTGEGALTAGSPVAFRLKRAAPNAPVAFIAGLAPANLPFYAGTLVPTPTLVLTGFTTDAAGKFDLMSTWPVGIPSGTKIYVQEWLADPSAPFGIAGSNALECVVP